MFIEAIGIVLSVTFSVVNAGGGGFTPGGVPPPSGSLFAGGSVYS